MPAGPDETYQHKAGELTEHVMKNSSSKTDNNASDHPLHNEGEAKGDKVQINYHAANPGPAVPQSMPEQEGSKADRQAKTAALNK
ncbi:uncharacterized protein EAF01_003960 [Botrytis porri]|uniref:Uncharacterized protein n=1 Tax=Botrytis porri TaxID=87229 RepID=A0A4Z1KSG0_9HELO|nr:uncharacterized protein EAF01_003960 [Botrytis porri]KAF7908205.1 hypothetical protein EAF01_003960 [Botrytis porri]TGO85705.1 hypothetical protein BPOR_0372g00090 [Botrytis porri]